MFPENSDAPSKLHMLYFMQCRFNYNSKFVAVDTCCDEKQVATLDQYLGMASSFIKRCPSCLQNFFRHFCDMTCASNQSDFLVVKGIDQDESKFLSSPRW
jgi:Niemann-Pick C1 N terminus